MTAAKVQETHPSWCDHASRPYGCDGAHDSTVHDLTVTAEPTPDQWSIGLVAVHVHELAAVPGYEDETPKPTHVVLHAMGTNAESSIDGVARLTADEAMTLAALLTDAAWLMAREV